MTTWVTVSQASSILGMSERSIRRHISEGKIESKLEGTRRLVRIDVKDDNAGIIGMTMSDKDALIGWLKNELEERNKQIERLQEEMTRDRERADDMVMRLADELEAQRNILESQQSGRKRSRSFWRLRRAGIADKQQER